MALKGGKLIDGTGKPPIEDAVVLFEGSKIKAVGENVEIPAGTNVIDCAGQTIIPGLIDAHIHVAAIRSPEAQKNWAFARVKTTKYLMTLYAACNARLMLEAGYTAARDMAGPCNSDRNMEILALREAINLGILPGPRLVVSGWVVRTADEPDKWLPLTIPRMPEYVDIPVAKPVDGVFEIRKRIREQIKWGCDIVKVESSAAITQEELNAMGDEAHQWGKVFSVHGIGTKEIKKAIAANCDVLDHGSMLDDEAIRLIVEKGIIVIPTMTVVCPKSQERYMAMGVSEHFVQMLKSMDKINDEVVPKAHKAGVKIAMGTDCSRNLLHGENSIELELMVKRGMSPMEAIVASTQTAAEAMGEEWVKQVGTLEAGKFADAVVIDGNPLSDIKILQNKSKLLLVIKGGTIQVDRRGK